MLRIALVLVPTILISIFFTKTIILFAIAFIVSSVLTPVSDLLSKKLGIRYEVCSVIIFGISTCLLIVSVMQLLPILYSQTILFIHKLPYYNLYFQNNIVPLISSSLDMISKDAQKYTVNFLADSSKQITNMMLLGLSNIWAYAIATIDMLVTLLFLPVLIFYFMRDYHEIQQSFVNALPFHYSSLILTSIKDIHKVLNAYIKGQLYVCLLLTLFYIIGLNVIGLDLYVLIGIVSGIAVTLPFVGIILSTTLAFISCLFEYGVGPQFTYTVGLYVVGNICEGWILTPKIMSSKVGLHPLWILFSTLLMGSMWGAFGLLLAIPVAGVCKILIVNCVREYEARNQITITKPL